MAINGESVLAVIPARGGSKRCPRKNEREYKGKSLVAWAIEAARGSKYIDIIEGSTDDMQIFVGQFMANGCNVFNRPPELATDSATNEDVLRHVAAELENAHEWVVLLQPTSPLRTAEDIDACIERAQMGDGCISYSRGNWQKNGAVYVARSSWIEKHDFSHEGLLKYYMDESRSLDIDYPEQFE